MAIMLRSSKLKKTLKIDKRNIINCLAVRMEWVNVCKKPSFNLKLIFQQIRQPNQFGNVEQLTQLSISSPSPCLVRLLSLVSQFLSIMKKYIILLVREGPMGPFGGPDRDLREGPRTLSIDQ